MKILEFRTSEIASAGLSGQVSVAKKIIHISALSLLFSSQESLFRSRADSFARDANLKLRQVNARAQAKVARVCYATALKLSLERVPSPFKC